MQKVYFNIKKIFRKMPVTGIVVAVFFILFLPLIYRVVFRNIKSVIQANEEMKNEERYREAEQMNPEIYAGIGKEIKDKYGINETKFEELKVSAHAIAYHMGTLVGLSWWQRLTENDREVFEELKKVVEYYPAVRELYYYYYTKSDNLDRRILDDLDNILYRQLKNYYLERNKTYF